MERFFRAPFRGHTCAWQVSAGADASLATAALLVFQWECRHGAAKIAVMEAMTEEREPAPQLRWAPGGRFVFVMPYPGDFFGGLITISLFAKSYKEAQSYIAPLSFGGLPVAPACYLSGTDAELAIVPLLNVSLLQELVTGEYHWNTSC